MSDLITSSPVLDPSPQRVGTTLSETPAQPDVAPPADFPDPAPSLPDAPDSGPVDDDPELDALLAEDAEEEVGGPPEVAAIDFDTPDGKKLAEQFKSVLGVDLKEALQNYTETTKQLAQMQQQMQEQAAQVALSQLSSAWGVTGPELDRRVERVLKAAEKLSPEQRAKYDSPKGIQELWSRIESVKAGQAPGSSGKTGGAPNMSQQTFKKSELRDMMLRNPALYNSQQAAIERAFKEGRIVDDL